MFTDLKRAARHLITHHRFSVAAVAILALSFGAHVAGFSVLHGTLFQPLPYRDPDRLVRIWESNPGRGIVRSPVSRGNFADWRELATSFELIGAFGGPASRVIRFDNGDPEIVYRASGTEDFMRILGVEPAIRNPEGGSLFLSHAFWIRRFGGDAAAARGTYTFETQQEAIGGAMPPGFDFPAGADVWGLMSFGRERASRDVNVIARLRPDRSIDQARAELETIAAGLASAHPADNEGWTVVIEELRPTIVGEARSLVWLLYLAVSLTLIVGVVNTGALLLSHAMERRRDIAIRLALGAPASRLQRQHVIETLLIVSTGTVAGLAAGAMALQAVLSVAPPRLPRLQEIGIGWPALSAAVILAVCVTGLFTIVHASALRPDTATLLSGGPATATPRRRVGRQVLIVSQIAICAALLVWSGIVVRSFVSLLRSDLGLRADGVLAAQVRQPILKAGEVVKHYPTRRFARVAEHIVMEATALPGVTNAAVARYAPVAHAITPIPYMALPGPEIGPLTGAPPLVDEGASDAVLNVVSPGFFDTLGIALLEGRDFTPADRLSEDQIDDRDAFRGAGVAVVNETFARQTWPGQRAVGQYVAVQRYASYRSLEVVGVVRDTRVRPGMPAGPAIYLPFGQAPMSEFRLLVRTNGNPALLAQPLRERLRPLGPDATIFDMRPMEHLVSELVAAPRFSSSIMSGLGLSAMLLTGAGLFSLLSFLAAQRRREFAIRLAIGAANGQIARMVIGEGVRLAAIGALGGIVAALAAARLLSHLIPELAEPSATTVAAMGTVVLMVSLLASYVPARQAARIDPIRALRSE